MSGSFDRFEHCISSVGVPGKPELPGSARVCRRSSFKLSRGPEHSQGSEEFMNCDIMFDPNV